MQEARWAVRQAAQRLTGEAPALTAGCAEALQAGLATRAAELKEAVVAAWRTGARPEDLAEDARMDLDAVRAWLLCAGEGR
ncbi:MAG: hypothetical protein JO362_08055 [Streptomycetaceae bacterium]|nr:hypothetical protein [Streptomycetaceae bacterium]